MEFDLRVLFDVSSHPVKALHRNDGVSGLLRKWMCLEHTGNNYAYLHLQQKAT